MIGSARSSVGTIRRSTVAGVSLGGTGRRHLSAASAGPEPAASTTGGPARRPITRGPTVARYEPGP